MKFPSPMHYAVQLGLEDGLAALSAGRLTATTVPSGVVASLKNRRATLKAALAALAGHPDEGASQRELVSIERLLDALEIKTGKGVA